MGIRRQGKRHMFDKIINVIKDKCPLIHNILDNLVLVSTKERNTLKLNAQKMKMAVNLLMTGLPYIRNSQLANDFVFLFGVLLV